MKQLISRYFDLDGCDTSVAKELRAGVTTFVTMVYVLFLNPLILQDAIKIPGEQGMGQLLTATALAACLASLAMGLLARYPFALAPGMGLNAYFTYTVVQGQGVPWETALGIIFLSGIVIMMLTVSGVRSFILDVLPADVKHATTAGVGLFLAFIGAKNAGLIVGHPKTLVTLGAVASPTVGLTLFGLLVTLVLLLKNVRGAVLIGIVASSAAAIFLRLPVYQGQLFAGFSGGILRAPAWPTDLWGHLNIVGALDASLLGILLTFVLVNVFDTAGTLLGLAELSGYPLKRFSHAFMADAIGTSLGAWVGTSGATSYLESAAGIRDGGRTGLTAVVVGLLFFLSIFVWPLATAVPAAAVAPALIIVGSMMVTSLRLVHWDDLACAFPAFLTFFLMPLTFSIANGISFGIIAHVTLKFFTGKGKETHWLLRVLALLLVFRYLYMAEV